MARFKDFFWGEKMNGTFLLACGLGAFLIGCLAVSYLYAQLYTITLNKYTIPIADLPPEFDGFTLLHLSDLHNKVFGKKQKDLLALIARQDYDVMVITGDLINRQRPDTQPVFDLLTEIRKPVYFVPGNHEWETEAFIREQIFSAPVVLMQNKAEMLARGKAHLWIAGVDDQNSHRASLGKALQEVDGAPVILLAHEPNIFDAIVDDVDLVLAGHTHGGQVRLPFIGALLAPDQGFFPKYDKGLYTSGPRTMLISSGLGESLLPLRFLNPPEILLITLTAGK